MIIGSVDPELVAWARRHRKVCFLVGKIRITELSLQRHLPTRDDDITKQPFCFFHIRYLMREELAYVSYLKILSFNVAASKLNYWMLT